MQTQEAEFLARAQLADKLKWLLTQTRPITILGLLVIVIMTTPTGHPLVIYLFVADEVDHTTNLREAQRRLEENCGQWYMSLLVVCKVGTTFLGITCII